MPTLRLAAASLLLCLGACDNVGRAFDPILNPSGPNQGTTGSTIQVVRAGGDVRDGRPRVRSIAPEGSGWPGAVPIAIEFSESVNEASIRPTSATGTDARIVLRVQGTPQVLPCLYDFLDGGKLLVMRPLTALSNEQNPTYEVVMFPDARDVDGVRFVVDGGEEVLSTFQVNQSPSITDGRILLMSPRDNRTDAPREAPLVVVFDRPANMPSVDPSTNFVLRQGGAPVAGGLEFPLSVVGQDDGRVAVFTPGSALAAGARHELVVDDTITFGADGTLDFRGRTPYSVFDTIGPQAPTAVHVGNPTTGFPDKINRSNMAVLRLEVTPPADAQPNDLVVARIYGFDKTTSAAGDIAYVERTATVPAPGGAQPVTVDFTGQLGTLAAPRFEDTLVDFAVQLRRGTQQSAFRLNDAADEPEFDVTPPTLTRVGPPGSTTGDDIYTDLEHLAFHGTASEALGDAMLTDGVNPAVGLFASDADGFFALEPVPLGRLTAPRPYTLTVTDRSGNLIAAPVAGNIVQRGHVTGVVAGTLTVEAYDDATLQPIAGATVLVDPGLPTLPATGQLVATTAANGVATFTGLATTRHTVTIVRAGYDLVTFVDTPAARVSLPLRPTTGATASFAGTAATPPGAGGLPPGGRILVGNSALADPLQLAIATTTASPNTIPTSPIRPNRPQVLTAFGGTFEPTGVPAFALHGYRMLGPTLTTFEPPLPPAAPGASARGDIGLIPTAALIASLTVPYAKDLSFATGLDTGNLVGGGPLVRVTASLRGFGGQVLGGVGVATAGGGTSWTINASWGLPLLTGLAAFVPTPWIVTEARDTGGRTSRHRALLVPASNSHIDVVPMPSIPVVTPPAGPATGSPQVTYADVLDRAPIPGGIAVAEITAQDPVGRRWVVLQIDADATGGSETLQLPDLAGASVAGLQAGSWSVRVDARVLLSLTGSSDADFVLSEQIRQEATFARSASVTFTVQ